MKSIKIWLALLITFTAGCSKLTDTPEHAAGGNAELENSYSTVDEMLEDTELLIEGVVLSQETVVHADMPFTISQVSVQNKLSGDLKGDTVSVIETGGVFKPAGKPGDDLPKTELKLNGVSTLSPGEHVVLFLDDFTGPQVDGAYIPVGAYQGKFMVNEDGGLKQMTDPENKLFSWEMKSINTVEKLKTRIQ